MDGFSPFSPLPPFAADFLSPFSLFAFRHADDTPLSTLFIARYAIDAATRCLPRCHAHTATRRCCRYTSLVY